MIAVISEAAKRAKAIWGESGKATRVDTTTIGFTAGAESEKVKAAAGATPLETRPLAIGTDAHSHPGRRTPAHPATGTALLGDSGNTFFQKVGGISVDIIAEIMTPKVRKGNA